MKNPKLVGTLLVVVPPVLFIVSIVMGIAGVLGATEHVLRSVSFNGMLIGIPLGSMLLLREKGLFRYVIIGVAALFVLLFILSIVLLAIYGGA